jgi:PPOX class probable FMN-dependent enzyme
MFKKIISSRADLRKLMKEPSELVKAKEINFLDVHCQSLIVRSPFLLLATSNQKGRCDVSPKGDRPGFVQVLDKHHLAIPDRVGNNRLDSIENILENPQVGLLFVIPGIGETLRVNGKAWIIQDDEILDKAIVNGKRPNLAIAVRVEEAFIHCAKAFIRSKLWEPEQWPTMDDLPSISKMLIDHVNATKHRTDMSERELDESLKDDYKNELY